MNLDRRSVLFIAKNDTGFWGHALSLARTLRDLGAQVYVFANLNGEGEKYEREGFRVVQWSARGGSMNPIRESAALWQVAYECRRLRPDIIHCLSLRQAIYGGVAGQLVGIPILSAITGLGHVFTAQSIPMRVLRNALLGLLRFSQRGASALLTVENSDDLDLLVRSRAVPSARVVLIRGAGVDTEHYAEQPEPDGAPVVALASRLLWSKGVGDFCSAAELLKRQGIQARFVLIGDNDPTNPASVPTARLQEWHNSGKIEFWGHQSDMRKAYAQTHIICLPTFYREGIPKVLLEAAAVGRPIVTTDVPGCRDIVHHKENGLLVSPRNIPMLVAALRTLLSDKRLRLSLGKRGRERAVSEFRSELVINKTLDLYGQLLQQRGLG